MKLGESTESLKPIKVLGKTVMQVQVQGLEKELPLVVVKDSGPNLLGRDWFVQLPGLLDFVHNLNDQSDHVTLPDVFKDKDDLFAEYWYIERYSGKE